jgi:hypothetical protein
MVKSAVVTFFILVLVLVALILMGMAYTRMEMIAFGREVNAFEKLGGDRFSFFGITFYFPIELIFSKVKIFITNYTSGILKLLAYILNAVEEGISLIFKS